MDKLHVTLIRGPIVTTVKALNNPAVPSITLAYLSAYIKDNGYAVDWVDAIGEGLDQIWQTDKYPGYAVNGLRIEEIVSRIPSHTSVIGINAMFSSEWPLTRDLIDAIKHRFPDVPIVAGGEHITALTEYSLRDCKGLDVCIRGEGEIKFLDFLSGFTNGRSFSKIDGICFIDQNNEYQQTGDLDRIRDVDKIPWPWWPEGYLETFWAAAKSAGAGTGRDMPMMVSRGCPYQCTFCSSPNMWTTRYVLRDPDDVISEIKHYISRYQISSVQLYDLTAITKKRWIVEFCSKLLEEDLGIGWSVPQGTRSETLDEETLSLLYQTGCHYLVYAPESGSPTTLKRIKKRVKLPRMVESIMTARRIGLVLRTNLIIGFPGETRREIFETIGFGVRMAAKGVDEVSVNILSPYPGSEIFEHLEKVNRVELGDAYFLRLSALNSEYLSLTPLTVHEQIPAKELALYRIIALLTCYALSYLSHPSRIIRTIKTLRSDLGAATVFEQRLRDYFNQKKSRKLRVT